MQIQEAGLSTELGDIGMYSRKLPKVLTDGERVDLTFNFDNVEKRGRVTSVFVKDSEGNVYEGELPKELSELRD